MYFVYEKSADVRVVKEGGLRSLGLHRVGSNPTLRKIFFFIHAFLTLNFIYGAKNSLTKIIMNMHHKFMSIKKHLKSNTLWIC